MLDNLVPDISLYITQWFSFKDKLALRLTSKKWLDIFTKKLIIREFVNNKFAEYIQISLNTDLPERFQRVFNEIELTYTIDEAERNEIRSNRTLYSTPISAFYSREQEFIDKLVIPDEFIDYITKVILRPSHNVFTNAYCDELFPSRLDFSSLYKIISPKIDCLQEWFPFYEEHGRHMPKRNPRGIITAQHMPSYKIIWYINCNKDSANYGIIKKVTINGSPCHEICNSRNMCVYTRDIKLY